MPSDNEIREFSEEHKVRVWGVNTINDSCRLGETAVVPFYDVVSAVAAARLEGRKMAIEENLPVWEAAVTAARAESYNDGLMRGRYERQVDAAIKGDSE
jgi:hypothetical protein